MKQLWIFVCAIIVTAALSLPAHASFVFSADSINYLDWYSGNTPPSKEIVPLPPIPPVEWSSDAGNSSSFVMVMPWFNELVNGAWMFSFSVIDNVPYLIDPTVAVGYDYVVTSGPRIKSVSLPNVGDGLYNIYAPDIFGLGLVALDHPANTPITFGLFGVDQFQVLGIETSAGLDPGNPMAFVTELTFMNPGEVTMLMIPITQEVQAVPTPEPSTFILVGAGLLGVGFLRKRRG